MWHIEDYDTPNNWVFLSLYNYIAYNYVTIYPYEYRLIYIILSTIDAHLNPNRKILPDPYARTLTSTYRKTNHSYRMESSF